MSVIEVNFGQRSAVNSLNGPGVDSGEMTDCEMGVLYTGRFPVALNTVPPALEHVQAGAMVIANYLNGDVTIASVTSQNYLTEPIPGLRDTYIAGTQGISDFTSTLADCVAKEAPVVEAAHKMYGAYTIGRILIRSAVLSGITGERAKLLRKLSDNCMNANTQIKRTEANETVVRRMSASIAVASVAKLFDETSKTILRANLIGGDFPTNPKVAEDFQYRYPLEKVYKLMGILSVT